MDNVPTSCCNRPNAFICSIFDQLQIHMSSNQQIESELMRELFANARDFLNLGLAFLLEEKPSPQAPKFMIVNIQMSMELLMKWHLVSHDGMQAIFIKDLTTIRDVKTSIWSGLLMSKNYNELKLRFSAIERTNAMERETLDRFQKYRNRIVHSFLSISHEEALVLAADLVFKTMRSIIEDESEPGASFKTFLDAGHYKKLIDFGPYVERAEERAESISEEDVHICWECNHVSLASIREDWYCVACGAFTSLDAAKYVLCPFCDEKEFVYDGLNVKDHGTRGTCVNCKRDALVEACVNCDAAVFIEFPAVEGKLGWYCSHCEDLASEEQR